MTLITQFENLYTQNFDFKKYKLCFDSDHQRFTFIERAESGSQSTDLFSLLERVEEALAQPKELLEHLNLEQFNYLKNNLEQLNSCCARRNNKIDGHWLLSLIDWVISCVASSQWRLKYSAIDLQVFDAKVGQFDIDSLPGDIDSLPGEILETILNYLPLGSIEFASAISVSRRWNCIAKGISLINLEPSSKSLFIRNINWMDSYYKDKIIKFTNTNSIPNYLPIERIMVDRICTEMRKTSKEIFSMLCNTIYQHRSGSLYDSSPAISLQDGYFNVVCRGLREEMRFSIPGIDSATSIPTLMLKLALCKLERIPPDAQQIVFNGTSMTDFDHIPNNASILFALRLIPRTLP